MNDFMIRYCCAQMHIGGGLFGTPELSMKASSHYIMANLLSVFQLEYGEDVIFPIVMLLLLLLYR